MKKPTKKGYAAPIIVTVLLLVYLAVYFGFLVAVLPGVWKFLLLVIPLALAGVIIHVCIERIKEIRSGEEDDLGKY